MIIVEGTRLIWQSRLIFFPNGAEVEDAVKELGSAKIIRLWQTEADLLDAPFVVERHIFRTSWVDLSKSLDSVFKEMSRTSRNEIHQAEKKFQGRLNISSNGGPAATKQFLSLYNKFARLKGQQFPLSSRRLSEYLRVGELWLLTLDNQLRCGHVFLHDPSLKRVRLIFSATTRLDHSDDTHASSALNRYLHWQEMQHYKARGVDIFDFGGIGQETAATNSIARFKLSLGGRPIQEKNYIVAAPSAAILYRAYKFYRHFDGSLRSGLWKAFGRAIPSPGELSKSQVVSGS